MWRRVGSLAVAIAVAALLAACGDGAADSDSPTASQRITRDFGRQVLSTEDRAPLEDRDTLLRLLRRYERVGMGYLTGSVVEIDGLRRREEEPETTWAYNINGIEGDESSDEYRVYPGDVIQWDYRDWYVTLDVRATVGAFPQTFTRGVFGRLFPTTVECSDSGDDACARVEAAFRRAGVATDGTRPDSPLPPAGQPQRARVLVGPWRHWRGRAWPHWIDRGARYSGVFARFSRDGRALRLLDWNARFVRSLGAGTGLVAALRPTEEDLLWFVTGVDAAGVERAARALDSSALRDAFAAVVTADGVEKIPLRPRPRGDVVPLPK